MNAAQMKVPVSCLRRVPRAVVACGDPVNEVGREGEVIDKRRGRRSEGVGVSPERGGISGEVDLARGPACQVTGTQGR